MHGLFHLDVSSSSRRSTADYFPIFDYLRIIAAVGVYYSHALVGFKQSSRTLRLSMRPAVFRAERLSDRAHFGCTRTLAAAILFQSRDEDLDTVFHRARLRCRCQRS